MLFFLVINWLVLRFPNENPTSLVELSPNTFSPSGSRIDYGAYFAGVRL